MFTFEGERGAMEEMSSRYSGLFVKVRACISNDPTDDLSKNLMAAYVACLPFDGLIELAVASLNDVVAIRRAVRTRLTRLVAHGLGADQLDALASKLLALKPTDRSARDAADALLSHIYPNLSPPSRHSVLNRWFDAGRRSSTARWLKAIAEDALLFDTTIILDYWRATRNPDAAAVLSKKADRSILQPLIAEMIQHDVPGWIISRAARNVGHLSEPCWLELRERYPATFLYLCSMLKRSLGDAEALAIVRAMEGGFESQRGLAIWSLGQMAKEAALDELFMSRDQIRAEDMAAILASYPELHE